MKKIFLTSVLFPALAVLLLTGCLKDKGFDNHKYGINDPDTQPGGVGFPLAVNAINAYGLNVSATTQVVNDLVYVNLEAGTPAPSDIQVTLTLNNSLITAYNTANSTAIQVLSPVLFNLPSLVVTIPAGKTSVKIPINVLNTTTLDPNKTYGIGITISAVSGNLKIADNLKNLLVVFSIKNAYDGTYEISGVALRAGDAVLSGAFGPYQRDLATSGPSSVQWQGQVLWANGSGSALPDGYQPNVTINPATNLVTSISSPNAAIFMTAPVVNTTVVGSTQHYDPATKTIYFEFSYGGGPSSRLFSMKAKYLHPR